MNTGQIIKSKSAGRYTIIPNEILRREDLSWQAKGLLSYLLSLPEDWVLYKEELHRHSKDGRHCTRSAFTELEEMGYILSVDVRNEKGHFKGKNYIVYESPTSVNPISENPISVIPTSDNKTLLNTNNTNTNNTNTKDIYRNTEKQKKEKFIAPLLEQVKEFFKQKGYREDIAIEAYQYYNRLEWSDSNGKKVKDWKRKMVSVWFKEQNKIIEPAKKIIHKELTEDEAAARWRREQLRKKEQEEKDRKLTRL